MPSAPKHPCVHPGCPALLGRGQGSRCPAHQLPEKPRGTRQERGYTADWYRIVKRKIREQPWCSICGHPGSKDNPLTGGHIRPLVKGGTSTEDNCQVECLHCNSSKQDR